ncbi:Nucleotide-binding, alpha-beta plait [Artemisia annua]|uniref:Nucleotide-binding, alpha-beta plait n=1 Tax=Artemisia annua TaxID=35608 RepID=A0A2U1LFG2_ARTAN|nr:Nucleotide-binding, alpha-beta plait [Artemisia annua]
MKYTSSFLPPEKALYPPKIANPQERAIEHVNDGKKICWARGNKTCDGDLVYNLGTIARFGTKEFIGAIIFESLTDKSKLDGQPKLFIHMSQLNVQLKQKVKQEEELFRQWKANDEKQLMQQPKTTRYGGGVRNDKETDSRHQPLDLFEKEYELEGIHPKKVELKDNEECFDLFKKIDHKGAFVIPYRFQLCLQVWAIVTLNGRQTFFLGNGLPHLFLVRLQSPGLSNLVYLTINSNLKNNLDAHKLKMTIKARSFCLESSPSATFIMDLPEVILVPDLEDTLQRDRWYALSNPRQISSSLHNRWKWREPRKSRVKAKLIDFSPGEKYLVTYSNHAPSNPHDSHDKYFARLGKNGISVYEAETFILIDKKSIKVKNLMDFYWSPTDPIFALFVPEQGGGNQPARLLAGFC